MKYNNTKLLDFISENKYKINDPKELEELQIRADMMECCHHAYRWYSKVKPCRPITKPPGLYESVMNNRKDNSCPNNRYLLENKVQPKSQFKNKLDNKRAKMVLDLKASII